METSDGAGVAEAARTVGPAVVTVIVARAGGHCDREQDQGGWDAP